MLIKNQEVTKSSDSTQAPIQATPTWTLSSAPATSIPATSQHVIPGKPCNHGPTLHYTGRIKLVSSLSALTTAIQDHKSLAVTTTFNNAPAIAEVLDYVGKERILSVRRTEEQCVACAVKLAHAVGALVVVA